MSETTKMCFLSTLRRHTHILAESFKLRETVAILLERGVLSRGEDFDVIIPARPTEQVSSLMKVLEKKTEFELLTFAEVLQERPETRMVGKTMLSKFVTVVLGFHYKNVSRRMR